MHILITGATGFIGSELCRLAVAQNFAVTNACRRFPPQPIEGLTYCAIGNIDAKTDWSEALKGCCVVIHLANAAHLSSKTPADYYQKTNVDGTIQLVKQALDANIKRFVFVSSIGVNGDMTPGEQSFDENSPAAPKSFYAQSKLEAEQALQSLAKDSSMEWVIVRPPMVYGANAPGNFKRLVKLIRSNVPLPFASINNRRSFISVENLSSALLKCAIHPAAANDLFLVSDGVDFSTPDFMRFVAHKMHTSLHLFPMPIFLLRLLLSFVGKASMATSLCNSLRINSAKICSVLEWQPLQPHISYGEGHS